MKRSVLFIKELFDGKVELAIREKAGFGPRGRVFLVAFAERTWKMAKYVTVTPAYGADYKKRADAVKAWNEGKDFILQDCTSPWYGKPCSCRNFKEKGTVINIRYRQLREIAVVKVK